MVVTERQRQVLLGALALVLIAVIARLWMPAAPAPQASNRPASTEAPRQQQVAGQQAQAASPGPAAVHLDALEGERPKPEASERNLFRFKQKAPPPPPPVPVRALQPVVAPPVPTGPPPPPPLAPITLKFIGLVEATTHGEKIAILSDGRNAPFYGKEGAIIEGRYRILKIGVESVELAYADGRGRQTIRLTGS